MQSDETQQHTKEQSTAKAGQQRRILQRRACNQHAGQAEHNEGERDATRMQGLSADVAAHAAIDTPGDQTSKQNRHDWRK
jgi:hypothetical protein